MANAKKPALPETADRADYARLVRLYVMDHEGRIATVTTGLAAKAPANSPTFTGTITFPNAAWLNSAEGRNRFYFASGTTSYYKSGDSTHEFRTSADVGQFFINATSVYTPLSLTSTGATAGIGYATGAGGTVTQATDKTTGVTLNKVTGEITLNAAALAAATIVTFTLTNSAIAATDLIVTAHHSGGTFGAYTINAWATGAGTASIAVRNNTAASLSEAIVIKFAVVKAVTA